MRVCAILAALVAAPVLAADEKPQPLTPIDLKAKEIAVVQPKGGSALQPTEIKTGDELAKSPLFGEGAVEKLKKEANFEKQKLVVFAWSGSGEDRLTGALAADAKTALFAYTAGRTKDLRPHFYVFVVPKDAQVKAERAPRAK